MALNASEYRAGAGFGQPDRSAESSLNPVLQPNTNRERDSMLNAESVLRGPRSLFINADIALPVSVVKLARTGIRHPSQWEGCTDANQLILVRFRHGHLWIGLTPDFMTTPIILLATGYGAVEDGYLSFRELRKRTIGVVDWPQGRQARRLKRPGASKRTIRPAHS